MPATTLEMLQTRSIYDGRAKRTLPKGEVVEVGDRDVARTLVEKGWARHPGDPLPEPVKEPPRKEDSKPATGEDTSEKETQAEPPTDDSAEASDEASKKEDSKPVTWDDVPISENARGRLNEVAPDADPETASKDEIEEWLGSKQMAAYVTKALDDYFGRSED